MIITTSEELRVLTGSFYANSDFTKISGMIGTVATELQTILGMSTLESLQGDAQLAAKQAVAYMATMRYNKLNDLSHETGGRKAKIDRENEARPFEWQLARDDRAHLEEYYRALDRLIAALQDNEDFKSGNVYRQQHSLIVKCSETLSWLTGVDNSGWLYIRLIPYLAESQRAVEKAYGDRLDVENFGMLENTDSVNYAAQKAVALGALALMGRRTSLQTLPYGLMKLFESNGGGNRQEVAELDRLDAYLKHLSREQHYWVNEMKQLRDNARGEDVATHLQMPENDPRNKFMRV